MALDPSELELEPEAVAARYERHLRETRPKAHEDLSDMLADHVARQKVILLLLFIAINIGTEYKNRKRKVGSLVSDRKCDYRISGLRFDSLRQEIVIVC